MVFERILEEISKQTGNGFSADYVHLGRNSDPVTNGQRKCYVDFPRKAPLPPKTPKKAKTDGASNDAASTTRKNQYENNRKQQVKVRKGKNSCTQKWKVLCSRCQ
mmetsp:Transcript_7039/g.10631  ORF Transcript_7039/g.10631 Transcript_7039/m.10631 type:complete len:105 (-) Transcript_7039:837-1151(-)